jgi:hypothetical protein
MHAQGGHGCTAIGSASYAHICMGAGDILTQNQYRSLDLIPPLPPQSSLTPNGLIGKNVSVTTEYVDTMLGSLKDHCDRQLHRD